MKKYRIGFDEGLSTGVAVLLRDNSDIKIIDTFAYSRKEKRLDVQRIKPYLLDCYMCFEDLHIMRGAPQSINVIKGLSRMIGIDFALCLSANENLRYKMINRNQVKRALQLTSVNASKDEIRSRVLKKFNFKSDNSHIIDAISLALGGFEDEK